jgi:hypothetical protein
VTTALDAAVHVHSTSSGLVPVHGSLRCQEQPHNGRGFRRPPDPTTTRAGRVLRPLSWTDFLDVAQFGRTPVLLALSVNALQTNLINDDRLPP